MSRGSSAGQVNTPSATGTCVVTIGRTYRAINSVDEGTGRDRRPAATPARRAGDPPRAARLLPGHRWSVCATPTTPHSTSSATRASTGTRLRRRGRRRDLRDRVGPHRRPADDRALRRPVPRPVRGRYGQWRIASRLVVREWDKRETVELAWPLIRLRRRRAVRRRGSWTGGIQDRADASTERIASRSEWRAPWPARPRPSRRRPRATTERRHPVRVQPADESDHVHLTLARCQPVAEAVVLVVDVADGSPWTVVHLHGVDPFGGYTLDEEWIVGPPHVMPEIETDAAVGSVGRLDDVERIGGSRRCW